MFIKLIFSKIKTILILVILKCGFRLILTTKVLNYKMKFIISNKFEYYSRFKLPYISEPLLVDWVNKYISPNDCTYDVGCNVGNYTILIAKKIQENRGNGVVYAFEPNKFNFSKLRENIIINKLDYYVNPLFIALGINEISYYEENSNNLDGGSGKLCSLKNNNFILSLDINNFLKFEKVQFPNHIKIDIDYNTEKLFEKADFLKISSLKSIYIEINHLVKDKIIKKLNDNNFKLIALEPASEKENNYLFLKNN